MQKDYKEKIRKYALANAVAHSGTAKSKSVLGKLLAENPEMRKNLLEVKSEVELVVEDVNALALEKQKKELQEIGFVEKPRKIKEEKVLPDLDVGRTFVMRFAPNPDGSIHIGNARPAILCSEYVKKYNGKFILRFDDTDPKVKVPEKRFYKSIKEDLKWLKIKWDKEIIASKRLNIYYSYAEELIKNSFAYVCTCDQEKWKLLKEKGKSCPCRKNDKKTNMKLWKKMLASNQGKGFKEGEAVLRIKTDMEAKNPAVRDWPAFRIIDKPHHPFSKKHLWPLYNFASAIDDHLLGVTHILRGQEHATNETKQKYLYDYFKWKYPETIIVGRFSMGDMVMSKSEIKKGIKEHRFTGWDDVRLGTIAALRRRGFQPEAIRQIVLDIGVKPSDVTISFENLAAYNRRLIDKIANRYFFVENPKKIIVKNISKRKVKLKVHPDSKKHKTIEINNTFYIEKEDYEKYKGLEVRLKDLFNIKLGEVSKYTGKELKATPKIHWVPSKYVPVRIFMPGKQIEGYGELNLLKTKKGEIVQFERFGFVKIEKITKTTVVAVFTHK